MGGTDGTRDVVSSYTIGIYWEDVYLFLAVWANLSGKYLVA